MSKKRLSEKELIEGMTPHTAHADDLATTSERDWGSYSENVDKADDDFLIQRDDVFGASRMETLLKMAERFNKNGTLDGETLKKIKGLTELNTPSENDYRMALKRIEAIFDAKLGTPEGDELEQLISFVEAYEEEHYPI
ncbi:hypothetical protein R7F07_01975 [Vibrio sp. YT-16]|uniref:hypothetical protein n=1 Tax=Vibrio TaxID=662 RepID=UPI0029657103|nr:hypothetical protein [Vibrio sp. YT-16]MDW1461225.1 hypothetical protein [Vibrio sp. YT-16]